MMTEEEETAFKERTIESLIRHGFPLEIKTHQLLKSHGWKSQAEYAFEDPDEEKMRRIDFLAWKRHKVDSKFFENVMITLIIECKKRENSAWVFYRTEKESIDVDNLDELIYSAPSILVIENESWLQAFEEKQLKRIILATHQIATEHPFIAIAGHDIPVETETERIRRLKAEEKGSRGKKQKNNRSDFLYRASLVVTKALESEIADDIEYWSDTMDDGSFPPNFEIYYPIIVFNGPMYEAQIVDETIHLNDIEYVQLILETPETQHVIDVVSIDTFESYLEMLDKELDQLGKIIESLKDAWDTILSKIREIFLDSK